MLNCMCNTLIVMDLKFLIVNFGREVLLDQTEVSLT